MQPCLTCARPDAAEINAALATSSLREVSRRYDLTLSSLHRHKEHLPKPAGSPNAPQNAPEAQPERKPVLREIRGLAREARLVLRDAKKEGDLKARTAAIEGARKCLRDCAEITKELNRAPSVSVSLNSVQVAAIEQHERVSAMHVPELLKHAGSCLGAHVLKGDALALRILADLNTLANQRSSASVVE